MFARPAVRAPAGRARTKLQTNAWPDAKTAANVKASLDPRPWCLRRVISCAILVALLHPPGAQARAQHLHGVVLSLVPNAGTVIVRHDAFGGMPAMTMTFRILPRARVRELQPGAIIDADVDVTSDPWTLRNVTSTAAQAVTAGSGARHVAPLHLGDGVPDTAFVDQNGKPFRFSQLRGQDVVLSFIYTRCQDARMCPLISAKFHALQSAAGKRRVHLVEVTLDPTYDRPPVLARYATAFGADPARWTLAVGDANQTLDFAASFGIATFPDPNTGIIHSENTVLIGPDGSIEEMFADPSRTPAEFVAAIDAEHDGASSPQARLRRWASKTAAGLVESVSAHSGGLRGFIVLAIAVAALGYLARRLYRAISTGNT
jgi:protein SCO1